MKRNQLLIPATLILTQGAIPAATYQDDLALLKRHTGIIELVSGDARVAIAPAWQGRVMTSTATGPEGAGFGWINPEVIEQGIQPESERSGLAKHIHVFGGEERLWFGPEGGPFALFFPPKVEQTFENWKTPAAIDTEPFEVSGTPTGKSADFTRSFRLQNRAGSSFDMQVKRSITLTPPEKLAKILGTEIPDAVQAVAYTTENTVRNTGEKPWTRETGAPSIWLLGMFNPTPETTIVIPFQSGDPATQGPIANTGYFGEIPHNRIQFAGSVLFYKGDGKERGKIGIPPKRSKGIAGSWQADSGTLTLTVIQPSENPAAASWPYVDSQWKEDVDPFGGDVINSYNDGPPEPGAKPLGPFYELESSSPALFLKPGESHTHTHTQTTIHLTGSRDALDPIANHRLGASLETIEKALP